MAPAGALPQSADDRKGELPRYDGDLEGATRRCVKELQTADKMCLEDLLYLVERNGTACEELAARASAQRSRIKSLVKAARRELAGVVPDISEEEEQARRGSSQGPRGLVSDILGILGLETRPLKPTALFAEKPSAPPVALGGPLSSGASSTAGAGEAARPCAVDIDSALEELALAPGRAMREAVSMLSNVEDLRRRFQKLRACWPALRDAICRAHGSSDPLEIASLVWTLQEALVWRGHLASWLVEADRVCSRVQDCVEQGRAEVEERCRWRRMAQELLMGLEKEVASRVAAVNWLRRTCFPAAPSLHHAAAAGRAGEQGGDEQLLDEGVDVLNETLEVAELVENRLVKIAGAVMRFETDHTIVKAAVAKLAALKGGVHASTEPVSNAVDALSGAEEWELGADAVEEAAEALRGLLAAIDQANAALANCPLPRASLAGDGGAPPAAAEAPRPEVITKFRTWVRDCLNNEADESE